MFGLQENSNFRSISSSARPISSLSNGSKDSGVFHSSSRSSSSPSEQNIPISGPPSPSHQINNLLHQTASLLAVNAQLRKEIEQVRATQVTNADPVSVLASAEGSPVAFPFTAQENCPQGRGNGNRKSNKPDSYKTVMCQAWLESKVCMFAENCKFAHGETELRPSKILPKQNSKYKTKLCDKYTTTGLCPYGTRCLFIHPDNGSNAYIRPDKLLEVSQRHALADLAHSRSAVSSQSNPGQDVGRPVTPVESQLLPLCPTPCRGFSNQQSDHFKPYRPHPSWPLEPAAFFTQKNGEMVQVATPNPATKKPTDPAAPITEASLNMGKDMDCGRESLGRSSAGYVSGHSTPDSVPSQGISPFSTVSSSSMALNITDDEPDFDFFKITGLDNLAEELTRNLELW